MILHDYHRSSAAFRVRIALNLKNVAYSVRTWNLDARDHYSPAYVHINAQGLLPTLVDGSLTLTQSAAIVEYLEEKIRTAPLLPDDLAGRARVRAIFNQLVCDVHPLTTRRVGRYLDEQLGAPAQAVTEWKQAWIINGLRTLDATLAADPRTGAFCHGDTPSLADIALVPQVVSAQALQIDINTVPTIAEIFDHCMKLPAFRDAHPDHCSSSLQQADPQAH